MQMICFSVPRLKPLARKQNSPATTFGLKGTQSFQRKIAVCSSHIPSLGHLILKQGLHFHPDETLHDYLTLTDYLLTPSGNLQEMPLTNADFFFTVYWWFLFKG